MEAVAVVIPAHDESETIVACLRSVRNSLRHCGVPPWHRRVVVVADDCTDATATLAREEGAHVVEVAYRNVGAVRRTGVELALELAHHRSGKDLWLSFTDADSVVPQHWIAAQLALARTADAVAGTVEVTDWSGRPAELAEHFARTYPVVRGNEHLHVHGANLGVRASAYLACGGFEALRLSEDQALVAELVRRGHCVSRPCDLPVVTSARSSPRAAGGFGDCLNRLTQSVMRQDHALSRPPHPWGNPGWWGY
ncbi:MULTISPECIES: glycosyltransferase family 2 protein [unclassified Nocardiopsis]|uniref:glycosyltransferase n=1 Tax=unclassified Nocardiopsis TaxID=2649073 RepID=UPI00066C6D48|nr:MULTISPECIES: glycosyltransferase [unclassified Nocardiopsis]MBQ1082062.1 glycosyltransferase [Nocardiopsis sp. B62]